MESTTWEELRISTLAPNYNRIKTMEEQCHEIQTPMLESLAKLFRDHQADHDFGICLLHRHQTIAPGYVMVHTRERAGRDICAVEPVGSRPQYACAFYLDEDQIRAYEFSSTPQVIPGIDFTRAFSSFIDRNHLQDKLGFCCLVPSEMPWIELVHDDEQEMISVQVPTWNKFAATQGDVTEWGFLWNGHEIECREHKKCIRPEGGGHKKEVMKL
jgi:hypothetical protein